MATQIGEGGIGFRRLETIDGGQRVVNVGSGALGGAALAGLCETFGSGSRPRGAGRFIHATPALIIVHPRAWCGGIMP